MKRIMWMTMVCVLMGSLALASGQVDLSEHGKDLMKAPFAARLHFYNAYHKDWMKSTYSERKTFLTNWHLRQIKEAKEARDKAREEARVQREETRRIKAEKKEEREKARSKAREKKNEVRALREEKRTFNKKVKNNQSWLKDLRRDSESNH